ncbi:MAG: DNA polymerase IV [Verrucomicrobiales bacterium]
MTSLYVTTPAKPRVIMHLDMDAFFAAVEQRDNPELRGKPVIVGSPPSQRGVVCAASYEARKFGVRSALPSSTAGRLCPSGVFIPPRIDHYREESREIMRILNEIGATIEPMSIDEAYLEIPVPEFSVGKTPDVLLQEAMPLAKKLKERIRQERELTASIGIAANKFLAKLGSDYQKPDGLTLIREEGKAEFLREFPVRAIHGVGSATEKALNSAGIFTMGDLQDFPGDLRSLVGSFSRELRSYAFGNDDRPLELGDEVKSISSEETFSRDTRDKQLLKQCLWNQAREIAEKLKRKKLMASTVQIKLRYSNFQTLSRQITVEDSIVDAREIYRLGCFLIAREKLVSQPIRLIGLGVSGITDTQLRQLKLF